MSIFTRFTSPLHLSRILLAAGAAALLLVLGGAPQTASAFECENVGAGNPGGEDNGSTTATACGQNSEANGAESTAIGDDATATVDNSTAVGADTDANAVGSTAIGHGAQTDNLLSTAVGTGSLAAADNSVALGAGSTNNRSGTVSVGNPLNERQITNVAPGTFGTDAANMNQLNAVRNDLWNDFKDDRDDLRRGIAGAVSLVTLTPSGPGKTVVNVGWGYYAGENAVGATVNHRLKIWEDKEVLKDSILMLNAGVGYGIHDDGPVARAGVGFEF